MSYNSIDCVEKFRIENVNSVGCKLTIAINFGIVIAGISGIPRGEEGCIRNPHATGSLHPPGGGHQGGGVQQTQEGEALSLLV